MVNDYSEQENELLKEMFDDKEKEFLNKLKFFKSKLVYDKFLNQTDRQFYESQKYYYEQELILLKSLQCRIIIMKKIKND